MVLAAAAEPGKAVTLVVDGARQEVRSSAESVAAFLTERGIVFDAHDRVEPPADSALTGEVTVNVTHLNAWTETVHERVAPAVRHVPSTQLAIGTTKVVDAGTAGDKEMAYLVTRGRSRDAATRRSLLAARLVRAPHNRVIAHGIGDYYALTAVAERGFDATVKLARRALTMIATAYTADCGGCSGYTAIGRPAGHGIVAVDPRVIPLGTKLFIPGYGHAIAGDTGGAIRGNRIDLGFNSTGDAFRFGSRSVVVYILQ
jgi:3D (Asp-Asp-Asp) domain-containing protein